jgi:predicted DCC family thiol-disulfide oxidoreductase YuxK
MAWPRPTLVFDGECGICRTWVEYWRLLTGKEVVYRPYQEAAGDFPSIPLAEFKRSMVLIERDERPFNGAAAAYWLLRYAPDRGFWWWLYCYVPGFAPLSELAYTYLSQRRGLLALLTRLFWGTPLEPARNDLGRWLYLRGLGLIYVAAFFSIAVQIQGLVGSNGILPVSEYLAAAHAGWGAQAYWRLPTLAWLGTSDFLLVAGAWTGVALGLVVTLERFERLGLIALFALYLSYVYAGQLFMSYQWDLLLLESGFLAIFLTGGSRIVVWLYRWLLFRFLFLAGLVKVLSGDATWRTLTALDYHFWTQPLPSPLAWQAAQLPHWLLATTVVAVLTLELVLAFFALLPRRPRMLLALLVTLFQLAIMATGSYNFFNLLTILLCLFLLDDQALRRVLPAALIGHVPVYAPRPGRMAAALAALVAILTVPIGFNLIWEPLTGRNLPVVSRVAEAIAPLLIVNPYGVFATTTTTRPEIIIEGSDDGQTWQPYVLPYMPGPVARMPAWSIPYQPRLDWQLWFASYASAAQNRWTERLLQRLLEGSAPVRGLFAETPFADRAPKYVRAQLYAYRLAEPGGAAWWQRQLDGAYLPQVSLETFRKGPLTGPAAPGVTPGVVPGPAQIAE